jgi:CO dehydrogenase/acetyl-CoA synthase epsilon subunit
MEWADSKRRDAQKYREFRERIKEAEGEATQRWLAIIEKAAVDGNWTAAAWKLERRRDMFVPRTKQEITAEIDAKIEVKDARERVLDKLAYLAERALEKEGD